MTTDDAPPSPAPRNEAPSTGRELVPALESILGQQFRVLDDGFVRVVDYMGSDAAVVQAARVSYGAGTRKVREDRGLIRYLMRHHHTTPFEMCEIKFHVRVPMDTWRQWIRHRTANVNEYSTRYSVAIDAAQCTAPTEWRLQSQGNRQGSGAFLLAEAGAILSTQESQLQAQTRSVYEARLAAGVAREQARKDLPLSTYTEAYWKIDLHNLLHFLELRLDSRAQLEIRSYAKVIGEEIVGRWCPTVWEAFRDYTQRALTFSGLEAEIATSIVASDSQKALELGLAAGMVKSEGDHLLVTREGLEFEAKLMQLGMRAPWK
jgi:thymidylate synthase (FAD)